MGWNGRWPSGNELGEWGPSDTPPPHAGLIHLVVLLRCWRGKLGVSRSLGSKQSALFQTLGSLGRIRSLQALPSLQASHPVTPHC